VTYEPQLGAPGESVRSPASSADPGATSSSPGGPSGPAQPSSSAEASSAAEFPLRTLADAPVDSDAADRFGYADIADGLARLIEGEQTATPLTIAISAPWGAGKTSLMRLVADRVVRQRAAIHRAPAIVVWFNAWMHDAAPTSAPPWRPMSLVRPRAAGRYGCGFGIRFPPRC
jgi:KAP family P-loop domain